MTKPFYVYVLESEKDGTRYVGMTQDPEQRLIQHNQEKTKFTKGHIPWRMIYKELVGDVKEARKVEKYYKSAAGRRKILKQFPKL